MSIHARQNVNIMLQTSNAMSKYLTMYLYDDVYINWQHHRTAAFIKNFILICLYRSVLVR